MEWISIEDYLPKINENVLVYAERKHIFGELYSWTVSIARRYVDKTTGADYWTDITGMEIKPTHWMELPYPPSAYRKENE